MKGLLTKDFHIISQNHRYLLIYVLCSFGLSFVLDSEYVVGYIAMLMGIMGTSTISYDEFDNGFPFLMSLPVDSKTYVREKFLFCLLLETVGTIFGAALICVTSLIKDETFMFSEILSYMVGVFIAINLLTCCLIPIELKYGAEKGRVVMMVFYGFIAAAALLLTKIPTADGILIDTVVKGLNSLSPALIGTIAAVMALLVICGLYLLSVSIMNKKEF